MPIFNRDHGLVREAMAEGLDQAREAMATLEEAGISMREAIDRLQQEAVRLFVEPFDKLLGAIEAQRRTRAAQG